MPAFRHIVVVVMENHSANQVIGSSDAPYLNSLARQGASLTDMHGIAHPSQPNYVAMFSGSTQGVRSDSCPQTLSGPNLATQLAAAHDTFAGYSESLPAAGFTGCSAGAYARKHNPWSDFANISAQANQPFAAFGSAYGQLPTVAYIVPNLDDDMHDGTVAAGDQWLSAHLGAYARWAVANNSLLIVTWDENDDSPGNQIATVLYGAHVAAGLDNQPANHYTVLRTIEDSLGLGHLTGPANSAPLTGFWRP